MEKRVFRTFRYTECDDFAAYLSKMAAEGWHFKEWNLGLIFEKGEPQEVTYSVQVFVKGSDMDLKATKDIEEYSEYCKAAGWEYVEASKKFVVFKKLREDAEEIVTQEERFRDAVNAEMKASGSSLIAGLLLDTWQIRQLVFDGFYYNIFSNSVIAIITVYSVALIYLLTLFLSDLRWYRRNKRKLSQGEQLYFGIGEKAQRKKALIWKVYVIAIFVLLMGIFALEENIALVMVIALFGGLFLFCICFVEYLRPNKVAHVTSMIAISIMVPMMLFMFIMLNPIGENIYPDKSKAPLLQEEYREVEAPFMQVQIEKSKNHFGSIESHYVTYYLENENPDDEIWDYLDYTVIESEYDWIIERSYRLMTEDKAVLNECSEEWGAKEAIQMDGYPDTIYVKYENQILMLDHEKDLTEEQIQIIRKKLNLGQVM